MAGFILGAMRRGLAEAGGVAEVVGIKALQSALDEQRMSRLEELRAANAMKMEKDVRQPFEREQQQARITSQEGIHAADRTSREGMARDDRTSRETLTREGFTHQTNERTGREQFEAEQKAEDRKLEGRRLDIQAQQVGAAVRAANIAAQKGEIEVGQLKRINDLQAQYTSEKDPDKRAQLGDQLLTLLGKGERYTPLMGRDDMNNPVYMGAFDTRRGELKTGGPAAGQVDFSQFLNNRPK